MAVNPELQGVLDRLGITAPPQQGDQGDPMDALVFKLRQQTGIPVRTSPWNAPPFYSVPIGFAWVANVALASTARVGVRWSIFTDAVSGLQGNRQLDGTILTCPPEKFPNGWFGVTRARCWVGVVSESAVAFNPHREALWSWIWQGQAVPGYRNTVPSAFALQAKAAAAGSAYFEIPAATQHETEGFVRMMAGQTQELEVVNNSGAQNITAIVTVRGWMAPLPSGEAINPVQLVGVD